MRTSGRKAKTVAQPRQRFNGTIRVDKDTLVTFQEIAARKGWTATETMRRVIAFVDAYPDDFDAENI